MFQLMGGGSSTASENKSALRAFAEKYMGGGSVTTMTKAKLHVIEGGQAIRQTSEGALTGAALGLAHAEVGLDYKGIPIDAVVAAAAAFGRGALAQEAIGTDVGNVGAACASVFSFRKTFDFIHAKKLAAGQKPAGQVGDSTAAKPTAPTATPAAGEMPEASDTSLGADPVIAMAERLAR